jgi:hypothetical protein
MYPHYNNMIIKLHKTIQKTRIGKKRKRKGARCWWLTPVILATQGAEIRRIEVRSQPRQIVCETLS